MGWDSWWEWALIDHISLTRRFCHFFYGGIGSEAVVSVGWLSADVAAGAVGTPCLILIISSDLLSYFLPVRNEV